MKIDRCVCHKKTFADLRVLAEEHDCKAIDELQKHTEVCDSCSMCKPYIEVMLNTGQTQFTSIL